MADNKQYFQWLDIPNQQGGNDRKWAKDAEAQAGIAQVASAIGFDTDDYVDLGLPSGTLWAKCNVGATTETGYGNYYMYGKGASQYNSGDSRYEGTEDPLDPSRDTATQVLGEMWRMPTKTQVDELIANTTYTWEEDFNGSGINGGKFTAANGNYIFFPAAGYYVGNDLLALGSRGMYWTSTPHGTEYGEILFFKSNQHDSLESSRNGGWTVRGVIDKTILDILDDKADKSELPTYATTSECRAIVTGYNS